MTAVFEPTTAAIEHPQWCLAHEGPAECNPSEVRRHGQYIHEGTWDAFTIDGDDGRIHAQLVRYDEITRDGTQLKGKTSLQVVVENAGVGDPPVTLVMSARDFETFVSIGHRLIAGTPDLDHPASR